MIATEVGHLDLGYAYLGEAAPMDLDDLEHNTRDGLHIASLAGSWIALVAGFGGMRERDGSLCFAPRLPEGLSRLAFCLVFQGRHLQVETTHEATSYRLKVGDDVTVFHFGVPTTVSTTGPVSCPTPADTPRTPGPSPTQPAGREPAPRGPRHEPGDGASR